MKKWHVFPIMRQNKEGNPATVTRKERDEMQMFDIVAAGILGLLIGFWSGRSLRWKIEETEEEASEAYEERKMTGRKS